MQDIIIKPKSNNSKYIIIFVVILAFVGLVWFLSPAPSSDKFNAPSSLEVPLHDKISITSVISENQTHNIIFTSNSSTQDLLNVYGNWARENNFVFVNEAGDNTFSLLPQIGSGHLNYHFSLETQAGITKVTVVYSEFAPAPNPDNLMEIPEDFRISF